MDPTYFHLVQTPGLPPAMDQEFSHHGYSCNGVGETLTYLHPVQHQVLRPHEHHRAHPAAYDGSPRLHHRAAGGDGHKAWGCGWGWGAARGRVAMRESRKDKVGKWHRRTQAHPALGRGEKLVVVVNGGKFQACPLAPTHPPAPRCTPAPHPQSPPKAPPTHASIPACLPSNSAPPPPRCGIQ